MCSAMLSLVPHHLSCVHALLCIVVTGDNLDCILHYLQVFELLASVPWLDEDDVKQKELKGLAMVSNNSCLFGVVVCCI